jgi:hypothetical protein
MTLSHYPCYIDETGLREYAMSTGGLSEAWLGRMHDIMAGCVERGEVPGIVRLVNRRARCMSIRSA